MVPWRSLEMARQYKGDPEPQLRTQGVARSSDDQSLILRSAESLGRVIGALQRQLDAVASRTPSVNGLKRKKVNGVKARGPANVKKMAAVKATPATRRTTKKASKAKKTARAKSRR
jgi:hypothetical protein